MVALVEEIHGALAPLGKPWEVLAVDDVGALLARDGNDVPGRRYICEPDIPAHGDLV